MPDSQNDLDFGRYHIQRLLGRGGMGEVYLARDTALERDVAIKFVSSQKLQDSAARARLLREAQAAAGLDHPCICPVHEAGLTEDGRAYIVMPFIDGTPLADIIPHGPMPPREALSICSQVADALATAHRHGIVHRDLKPGNIMMTTSGRPRLLDFGIAQTSLVPHVIAEATTVTVGPATSGGLVGTPAYMSPEQVQHRQVDGRSDLFALGVVLYECLTGARAFDGPTPYEAVANVLRVDPPPPSGRVPGLDSRHDALCARLMAKDPNDRFQSAEEVVGAIRVLLPDTGRITGTGTQPIPPPTRLGTRLGAAVALAIVAVAAAFGVWRWSDGGGPPAVPADSLHWYERGVEALRDGAYQTARGDLDEAVRLFPQNALAYARLAEADRELDDERSAQAHLLRLSSLVPDESRLSDDDQLRVRAIRALVLRDVDKSVYAYQELVKRHQDDPGAWVDLGRAQDAAGLRDDAQASFEQAVTRDRQYPAAYLQLASIESAGLHVDRALESFGQAERLYKAASDTEGETEVLLRRAGAYDAVDQEKPARADLERARTLAAASKSVTQDVRARLTLSSVTASEGDVAGAVTLASRAVDEAIAAGLDTVAAGGLIDLAAGLMDQKRLDDAAAQLQRAIRLADDRAAAETAARARIQLAEVLRQLHKPTEALALVNHVLPFVRSGHYRRFELDALQVAIRSHQELGELDQASAMAAGLMTTAEAIKDEGRIAVVASELASVLTDFGQYPQALQLRVRAEDVLRRRGDQARLPYTLANHADLLVLLGRSGDANQPLTELESGIAAGFSAYTGRARRAASIRALQAATTLQCDDALRFVVQSKPEPEPEDPASLVASGVGSFCEAVLQRRPAKAAPAKPTADRGLAADRQYWLAMAALVRGDAKAAEAAALDGLTTLEGVKNDEIQWRLATAALAAARRVGDATVSERMAGMSNDARARLQASWKDSAGTYLSRADLVDLRKRAAQ